MNESERLTIGIVGLGESGRRQADHLVDLGQEVVGADASPESRRTFERQFKTDTYQNPTHLYESGIDGVLITTPNKYHEAAAVGAFEADLDVLIEKPLAHTLESAEQIAAAHRKSNGFCMVGTYYEFLNQCRILKSYIQSEYMGEVTHIQGSYLRRRGIPGRGSWYTSRQIAGGGALIDIGVHVINLILYLYDFPAIDSVSGITRTEFGNRQDYSYLYMFGDDSNSQMFDVDDSTTALIEFEGGKTASLEVAWAANAEEHHRYNIRGTEAGAHLDITGTPGDQEPKLTLYETRSIGEDHMVNSTIASNTCLPSKKQLATFVEAIHTGEPPVENTIDNALTVQRLIEELYDNR